MKAFFDFIPVLLFFLAYVFYTDIPISYINDINNYLSIELSAKKSSGIYFATLILMIAYSFQFIILFVSIRQKNPLHYSWYTSASWTKYFIF